MGKQEIHCSVSSCYYWHEGDQCRAERILVRLNTAGAPGADAGYEFGELGRRAEQSPHTMCETFVPEHKGPKPGISRIEL